LRKPIKRLAEPTNGSLRPQGISFWGLRPDIIIKLDMKKSQLHIHLVELEVLGGGYGEQSAESCMLAHRCPHLIIVNSGLLSKAFGDMPGSVDLQRPQESLVWP
jgi:hypothetical protein